VETIDYFLQRYQEHLTRNKKSEGELEQMVEAYRAHLERANAKAATKLDSASRIEIGGNDSRPADGHREHPVDETGAPHHGQDAWVPVTLDIDKKVTNGNGNGNGHAPFDEEVMSANGHGGNGTAKVDEGAKSSTYDRIRMENTAGDDPEDELGSESASCNLPGQDYPKKAYEQLKEYRGKDDEDEDEGSGNLIRLVDIKLPATESIEEKVEAD
jgi:hypothetical protein